MPKKDTPPRGTKSSAPEGAARSPIPELSFDKHILSNGLDLILHADRKLPVVHVNLWYHVGSKNEKPGKTGFAHLFEHMMFTGSKNVRGEYVSLMEKAGANIFQGGVNGTTNFDRTNYFETVPAGSLELVLWAESDRMGYLLDTLTQENLDNQRDVVKNERRQSMDNVPYGTAMELLFQNLFPKGHPYSWHIIGSMEDLENASLEDVREFFRTFYRPNNCTLVIAGDFDPDETLSWVESYFGSLPPGPPLARPQRWVPALDSERRLVVHDRVPQERLYLAWPAVPFFERDDAALDLVSSILSTGKNSRFYRRLVYDEQIASDVTAFNYSLEISGMLGTVATARPGIPLSRLEATIDEEIERFAAEGPTDEEIERVRAQREFDFLTGLERIGGFGGKADRLALYNTFLGDPDFFRQDYDRYQSLAKDELRSAAERFLKRPRLGVSFLPERSIAPRTQEPDRSDTPPVKPTRTFAAPRISSTALSNGLTLHVVERHEIPKVALAVMLDVGAAADTAERAGLAYFTAQMLDEGTTTRTALDIEAELEKRGSHLSSGAHREWSVVSLDCLRRHLEPSLEVMADVMLNPIFPEQELERLRKQRLDAILQERANPGATAGRLIRRLVFGFHHPYGWSVGGEEETVKDIRRDEVEAFYRRYYIPENAGIIMVGDLGLEEASEAVERVIGRWTHRTVERPRIDPVPPSARRVFAVHRPGSAQSELRMAFLGPERATPDYHSLEVLNTVLGGGFSSRLNLNLREDKGYSYGAFSVLRYGRLQSILLGTAPVESSVTQAAALEMLSEFEALAAWTRPVSRQELEDAKGTLIQGYAQRFESLGQIAVELAELQGYGLDLEELDRYASGIEAVSVDAVRDVARKILRLEEMVLLVVGDAEVVEPGLASLGLGPVLRVDFEGRPLS